VPPGHPLEPPLTATCCIRVRCTKGLLQLQAVIVYRGHDACIVAGRLWAVLCHPGGGTERPAARPARHGPCGQALQSESITDRHHIEREKSVSDYCDIEWQD